MQRIQMSNCLATNARQGWRQHFLFIERYKGQYAVMPSSLNTFQPSKFNRVPRPPKKNEVEEGEEM